MKRLAVWTCAASILAGLVVTGALAVRAEDPPAVMEIQIVISPKTIALHSDAEWVTVHTSLPLAQAAVDTLALNGLPVAWTKADAKGNLVAKFVMADVKAMVEPPSATLTLTGETIGGIPFAGTDTVTVR
mgnify:CR=1 FL=1